MATPGSSGWRGWTADVIVTDELMETKRQPSSTPVVYDQWREPEPLLVQTPRRFGKAKTDEMARGVPGLETKRQSSSTPVIYDDDGIPELEKALNELVLDVTPIPTADIDEEKKKKEQEKEKRKGETKKTQKQEEDEELCKALGELEIKGETDKALDLINLHDRLAAVQQRLKDERTGAKPKKTTKERMQEEAEKWKKEQMMMDDPDKIPTDPKDRLAYYKALPRYDWDRFGDGNSEKTAIVIDQYQHIEKWIVDTNNVVAQGVTKGRGEDGRMYYKVGVMIPPETSSSSGSGSGNGEGKVELSNEIDKTPMRRVYFVISQRAEETAKAIRKKKQPFNEVVNKMLPLDTPIPAPKKCATCKDKLLDKRLTCPCQLVGYCNLHCYLADLRNHIFNCEVCKKEPDRITRVIGNYAELMDKMKENTKRPVVGNHQNQFTEETMNVLVQLDHLTGRAFAMARYMNDGYKILLRALSPSRLDDLKRVVATCSKEMNPEILRFIDQLKGWTNEEAKHSNSNNNNQTPIEPSL
jgi:hypothetical protein